MIKSDTPRRVRAILDPVEIKPRKIWVGKPTEYYQLPMASERPMYIRPGARDLLVYTPTLGDQLRDSIAIAVDTLPRRIRIVRKRVRRWLGRVFETLRELDGVLWDADHPGAFWAAAACFAAVTIALTYFVVQLLLSATFRGTP